EWQLGSWLLCSGLSMARIESFLKLDLVGTHHIHASSCLIQLCLCAEMLPSGPLWKSLLIRPMVPTKHTIALYYRDPIDCIQALLSHPFFEHHILFVPQKVWSMASQLVRVYNE
ncbi:hypothetical protein OG21DRAFT_1379852, partial [Imleria badia]